MPLRSDLQVNLLNFKIALEAIAANKLRALLTGLGIIFGVSAVIAMLAIGKGAQEEILRQIKLKYLSQILHFYHPPQRNPVLNQLRHLPTN